MQMRRKKGKDAVMAERKEGKEEDQAIKAIEGIGKSLSRLASAIERIARVYESQDEDDTVEQHDMSGKKIG